MARVEAIINPALLIWARESAGYVLEEAATKAGIPSEKLSAWENGDTRPTIRQLRELGRVYRRPLAVFYLPEPPHKFQPLHDFRRLPNEVTSRESPELRFAIARARYRREVALELMEGEGEEIPNFQTSASLIEDPEDVGARIRDLLGVTNEIQFGWTKPREAFNAWREAFERAGILVFQAVGVELEEMRGFSISQIPLPAVVVNIKDTPRGRIFSMFHEFIHLLLREEALCDLRDQWVKRRPQESRVEVFCNRAAGAALVPRRKLLWNEAVIHHQGTDWKDEEIASLAQHFSVSREVILRRLLILDLTSEDFYQHKRTEYQAQYRAAQQQKRPGFAPPSLLAYSNAGPLYTRLVLRSYYDERITTRDVSEYLDVRLKHLSKIERMAMGTTVSFGGTA